MTPQTGGGNHLTPQKREREASFPTPRPTLADKLDHTHQADGDQYHVSRNSILSLYLNFWSRKQALKKTPKAALDFKFPGKGRGAPFRNGLFGQMIRAGREVGFPRRGPHIE